MLVGVGFDFGVVQAYPTKRHQSGHISLDALAQKVGGLVYRDNAGGTLSLLLRFNAYEKIILI